MFIAPSFHLEPVTTTAEPVFHDHDAVIVTLKTSQRAAATAASCVTTVRETRLIPAVPGPGGRDASLQVRASVNGQTVWYDAVTGQSQGPAHSRLTLR